MGRGPGAGTNLQSELAAAREAAESALTFFVHVAPLAQRLGMTDFPEFSVFESRFCQTDDLRTAQLRADGVVVQQLRTSVASAVEVQKQQEGVLAEVWPDGAGIVALQQLRLIIPRAETELANIADIGAGMLIAADCIDVARVTQYSCIAVIDPDNLLGVPIALWLKLKTACSSHHAELRAAIIAAVELFETAVTTCDDAIEAILAGLCDAMAAVGSADQPAAIFGAGGEIRPGGGPAGSHGGGDGFAVAPGESSRGGVQANSGPGDSSVVKAGPALTGPSVPDATPVSAHTFSGGQSGVPAAVGTSSVGSAPGPGASAFSGEAVAELLGPLVGVAGTIAAAAVTGLAEAVTTALAQGGEVPADGPIDTGPAESARSDGRSGSDSPGASITLGDKTIEIKAGTDGASVSLTVTGAGGETDTRVLEVRPDGSIGTPAGSAVMEGAGDPGGAGDQGSATADEPATAGDPAIANETATEPVAPTSQSPPAIGVTPPAASHTPCPPVESGSQATVPKASPQAATRPMPDIERTTPGDGHASADRGTPVSPQSSQPAHGVPPADDGQLALAGDQ